MATKYYALLTNIGAAKLANATALGEQVEITQMAVGDGNGALPTPNPAQTALVHELRRAPLNTLTIDPVNTNQIITEQVIPEDVGGWWIREIGLFDSAGDLIAIANCAETYKPLLQEGSGRVQVIRVILIVSSTQAITLKIDPSVVLATRQYVDDAIIEVKTYVDEAIKEHAESRNHPNATLKEKGFVQLSNDANSTSETLAATPKAVKAVSDAALKITNNLSDLKNKSDARGALELGTAATKNVGVAGGNVMQVGAFGLGGGSNHKVDAYNNVGEIYRVNNTSANAPTTGVAGVISLPCDGGPSTAYAAVSNAGAAWVGSSNIQANGIKWNRVYTDAYKPTATDVGAITRADAPIGIPQPWPTATAPTGWLKCNGATFDKAKYPLLAVAYPDGKLPDLRGEFIRGWDDGKRVDVGRQLLSWQAGTLVGGKDDNTDGGDISYLANGSSINYGSDAVNAADYPGIVARYASTGVQINPATPTYNFFSVTRPRNIAFNYIVRAA
ncbi:phage tail protein [Serratia odorifera]|uniref:Phage tail fiber repeat protein n=1 Tax=Serratia odorifera DSM 4582 TaxID=667129 RepID=D4DZ45_SEROD|nr:phage tail protein [Serratia odorifera]EFE97103.1 phage tail fiber repeat protein [Serratia odorifera DSM 4582]PNK91677.1 phage tail protein [Serratia odorifera]RII72739.1 phage tail protein [Serratia odorifera]